MRNVKLHFFSHNLEFTRYVDLDAESYSRCEGRGKKGRRGEIRMKRSDHIENGEVSI
jgi:hypothetical protein